MEQVIINISGAIIIILLGIIAFFLQKFAVNVDKLGEAVQKLEIAVSNDHVRMNAFRDSCGKTHDTITTRLNSHSDELKVHGKRIEKHETEIEELKRR